MDFDELKKAADSIKMPNDMKNRIKENCISGKKEKAVRITPKKVIAFACAFVIIFSISIGIPIFNNDSNSIDSKTQTSTKKSGGNSVFGIKAYATSDGKDLYEKEVGINEKITLSTEAYNRFYGEAGNDKQFKSAFGLHFQIVGKNINSITFKTTDGYFDKKEETSKEVANSLNLGGYQFIVSKECICGGVLQHKVGERIVLGDPTKKFWGFKMAGQEYTVAYEDQTNMNCLYSLVVVIDNHFENYGSNQEDYLKLGQMLADKLSTIVLTAQVNFKDGTKKDYFIHFNAKHYTYGITMYMTDKQ